MYVYIHIGIIMLQIFLASRIRRVIFKPVCAGVLGFFIALLMIVEGATSWLSEDSVTYRAEQENARYCAR